MPVDIRNLSPELQIVAKDELNENPEKLEQELETFRELIQKTPHLKSRTDDQFLVTFLRGCKYNIDRAIQKLDMYYTLRNHMPELMLDRDPMDQKLRAIIRLG